MSMHLTLELGILVLLTLVNGLFAGAEIALVSVRETRLRELAARGDARARAATALRATPEKFFATVQIGVTVITASAALYGGVHLDAPIENALVALGVGRYAGAVAYVVVVALVSGLSLVLGELVPKSIALRKSERFALLVAPPLLVLATLIKPLVWLVTASANVVLRPLRDRATFTESRLSLSELHQLIDQSVTSGTLSPTTSEIASRALDLVELSIGAMMIPRRVIVVIPHDATPEIVASTLRNKPHARYPVAGADDALVGYVLARELYERLANDEPLALDKLTRPMLVVTDDTPAANVLRALQARKQQLALVTDAVGSVVGLVTIEDIAEVLLGDILEEHEHIEPSVRREPTGSFVIRGDTPVRDVEEAIGEKLAKDASVRTIGAVVVDRLGHAPHPGDCVPIGASLEVEVLATAKRRVRQVEIRRRTTLATA
jgi:putative hemolysin